eukprot:TRINITY_DN26985_c0_g1_i1.p1 TRINITY_DN26985_c0_g1~~TRINITY_DN26985_c0_g1_i1.p1  ORF type:complete len:959 (+),score=116.25 TRINITY_DN26985_c0_g1_i1:141-3017(+)
MELGSDDSVIALNFKENSTGKTFADSKVRYTWELSIDGTKHTVEFTNTKTSGKKRVFVDGRLLHELTVFRSSGFQYSWPIGGHLLSIVPVQNQASTSIVDQAMDKVSVCQFELRVNGLPFRAFRRRPTRPVPVRPSRQEAPASRPTEREQGRLGAGAGASYGSQRGPVQQTAEVQRPVQRPAQGRVLQTAEVQRPVQQENHQQQHEKMSRPSTQAASWDVPWPASQNVTKGDAFGNPWGAWDTGSGAWAAQKSDGPGFHSDSAFGFNAGDKLAHSQDVKTQQYNSFTNAADGSDDSSESDSPSATYGHSRTSSNQAPSNAAWPDWPQWPSTQSSSAGFDAWPSPQPALGVTEASPSPVAINPWSTAENKPSPQRARKPIQTHELPWQPLTAPPAGSLPSSAHKFMQPHVVVDSSPQTASLQHSSSPVRAPVASDESFLIQEDIEEQQAILASLRRGTTDEISEQKIPSPNSSKSNSLSNRQVLLESMGLGARNWPEGFQSTLASENTFAADSVRGQTSPGSGSLKQVMQGKCEQTHSLSLPISRQSSSELSAEQRPGSACSSSLSHRPAQSPTIHLSELDNQEVAGLLSNESAESVPVGSQMQLGPDSETSKSSFASREPHASSDVTGAAWPKTNAWPEVAPQSAAPLSKWPETYPQPSQNKLSLEAMPWPMPDSNGKSGAGVIGWPATDDYARCFEDPCRDRGPKTAEVPESTAPEAASRPNAHLQQHTEHWPVPGSQAHESSCLQKTPSTSTAQDAGTKSPRAGCDVGAQAAQWPSGPQLQVSGCPAPKWPESDEPFLQHLGSPSMEMLSPSSNHAAVPAAQLSDSSSGLPRQPSADVEVAMPWPEPVKHLQGHGASKTESDVLVAQWPGPQTQLTGSSTGASKSTVQTQSAKNPEGPASFPDWPGTPSCPHGFSSPPAATSAMEWPTAGQPQDPNSLLAKIEQPWPESFPSASLR